MYWYLWEYELMTDKSRILQEKTRYINAIKQLDDKIHKLQKERKEYSTVIDTFNRELEELRQPKLF